MAIRGVTPYLWFDEDALPAAELYTSLFPDSRITSVSHYQEGSFKPAGTVLVVEFEIFGQRFAALNGGPNFPHSEAVSFQVSCETQEEIDRLWSSLIADGGAESQCGWCKDKWGVSWQITASRLEELLSHSDAEVSHKAWQAMLGMTKIDLNALEDAVR